MSTFLVEPPPHQERMDFMDALEDAGIDYSREPDGYYVYLREGQQYSLEEICRQFHAQIVEEDPATIVGL